MTESKFIPLPAYREYPIEEMGERAFLVLVVGYPAEGTTVPDISARSRWMR